MASALYLIAAFLLNAAGTVAVKLHAERGFSFAGSPLAILSHNVFFLAGLACFGLNLVMYSLALAKLPVSVAYPVMTVASFILVNAFSYFYFRENINLVQVAGYLMIMTGIVLVVTFAKNAHA
ncbi:MAG TPA: SMR family transporter [Verrucomicrobiae bacterium]|nr:SMR family transporter [Verrucomicrobiae bacterium]